ncbi:hypothetical protein [Halobacillus amylolyticus]|nr:hypothetical protein [Halobacillus amylolyticus]
MLGKVTGDGVYRLKSNGEIVVEEQTGKLKQIWKGAIPCLVKSKA